MKLEDFIPVEGQKRVEEAIAKAERETSGEIRVHVEQKCKARTPYDRAVEIFDSLKMYETRERNGVLIYIAFKSKVFAIVGDKGIDEAVPEGFWNEEKEVLAKYLGKGEVVDGLCRVIEIIGDHLSKYFPCQPDDTNELSNEISYGE